MGCEGTMYLTGWGALKDPAYFSKVLTEHRVVKRPLEWLDNEDLGFRGQMNWKAIRGPF